MRWTDIAFMPDEAAVAAGAAAWAWRLPGPWRVVLCSMFGGLFLEGNDGAVVWLECGTGLIEPVADSADAFHAFLGGPRDAAWRASIDEWFLPGFVERLHAAGKRPGPGQCYGLTILPVFQEGRYEVDNVQVVPTGEWFAATGSTHHQLQGLADGERVRLKVVD